MIAFIASKVFTIYRYHEDNRVSRRKQVIDELTIDDILRKTHAMFNENEASATIIVVSTYQIWANRNESTSQRIWRQQRKKWTSKRAKREKLNADFDWDCNLKDCFDLVICDEAHMMKIIFIKISKVVQWLCALFHIMITATSISNDIENWENYMLFVKARETHTWWFATSLDAMNIIEAVDSFSLKDDHSTTKLQVTMKAYKKWIRLIEIFKIEKDYKLSKMWRKTILRRTNASRISFKIDTVIDETLSTLRATAIDCKYISKKALRHDQLHETLVRKLLIANIDNDETRTKWSLTIHRRLQLLTMFLNLLRLNQEYDLKVTNMKRLFQNSEFYYRWLHDLHSMKDSKNSRHVLTYIHRLCDDALKLRALLKNIQSQISSLCAKLSTERFSLKLLTKTNIFIDHTRSREMCHILSIVSLHHLSLRDLSIAWSENDNSYRVSNARRTSIHYRSLQWKEFRSHDSYNDLRDSDNRFESSRKLF